MMRQKEEEKKDHKDPRRADGSPTRQRYGQKFPEEHGQGGTAWEKKKKERMNGGKRRKSSIL